jgi:hypothetical protein
MREESMRGRPQWRNACVVRAQTIAANLRMIEFAVEGGLPAFGQGARTCVRAVEPGIAVICSHVCVHVGEGRMRVLVAGPEGGRGERFMWSLIEGARVRLTAPAASAAPATEQPRIDCGAGVRLGFGDRPREAAGPRFATRAANGNAASRRMV